MTESDWLQQAIGDKPRQQKALYQAPSVVSFHPLRVPHPGGGTYAGAAVAPGEVVTDEMLKNQDDRNLVAAGVI